MKKIIGMGNALVDVLARLEDDSLLKRMNLQRGGMTLISDEQAGRMEEALRPLGPTLSTGGCAANTIVALAGLLADAAFIGTVGRDEMGRFFAEHSERRGIRAILSEAEAHTGVAYALITPDGERTFGTCLGAAAMLSAGDVTASLLRGYDILHVEGYLVHDASLMEAVARTAKQAGLMLSLDLASPNVVAENRDLFRRLVSSYFDIVFANEEEAMAYTQETTPEGALKVLAKDCMLPVVKMGSRGACAMLGGERASVPARRIPVVDTTGAGDFFAGGFLYGFAGGTGLAQCLQLGACLAEAVIQQTGTSLPDDVWVRLRQEAGRIRS
jgi:sugar/nucleoside kinase (ribokinase family)